MTDLQILFLALGFIGGSLVSWVALKFLASHAPTEKALALKALTKAIAWVGSLNSATPEQAAALAAEAAKEAALIDAAKEAVGKL